MIGPHSIPPRDRDRARYHMMKHRERLADQAAQLEAIERWEQRQTMKRTQRIARRNRLIGHLHDIRRLFDPLGDHR